MDDKLKKRHVEPIILTEFQYDVKETDVIDESLEVTSTMEVNKLDKDGSSIHITNGMNKNVILDMEDFENIHVIPTFADGLNIDFYAPDFKEQLNKLDKNKKYIYHCRSGSRSARAVPIFKELGFKEVLELDGGINAWKKKFAIINE